MIKVTEDNKSMPMSELADMMIRDKNNMLRSIRLLARKYNRLGVENKERVARLELDRKTLLSQYGSVMRQLHAYAEKYKDWTPQHAWELPPNA